MTLAAARRLRWVSDALERIRKADVALAAQVEAP